MGGDSNRPLIAALAIGRSPASNLVSEIKLAVEDRFDVKAFGALDNVSDDAIRRALPTSSADTLYTTLASGEEPVLVSKSFVLNGLVEQLETARKNDADVVMLCCTGGFDNFGDGDVVCASDAIADAVRRQVPTGSQLGVFVPDAEQEVDAIDVWSRLGYQVTVEALVPAAGQVETREAAERMKKVSPDAVVLDCMGYTHANQAEIQAVLGIDTVLAISAVAQHAAYVATSR